MPVVDLTLFLPLAVRLFSTALQSRPPSARLQARNGASSSASALSSSSFSFPGAALAAVSHVPQVPSFLRPLTVPAAGYFAAAPPPKATSSSSRRDSVGGSSRAAASSASAAAAATAASSPARPPSQRKRQLTAAAAAASLRSDVDGTSSSDAGDAAVDGNADDADDAYAESDDAAAAAADDSDSTAASDVDAQPHVRRSKGKWVIAGRVETERYCFASCPTPFADVGEYEGVMASASRWA